MVSPVTYFLALLCASAVLKIFEINDAYFFLGGYVAYVKTLRVSCSVVMALLGIFLVLKPVWLSFVLLRANNYANFLKDFGDFLTSALRGIITAPVSVVYWFSGADYKLVKSKWVRSLGGEVGGGVSACKAFWRSDTQYFIAGFFIILVGVYIFSATAYFLSVLAPIDGYVSEASDVVSSIPFFGNKVAKVLANLPDAVLMFSAVVAFWAMWIDRAIYSDKSIERYYWSSSGENHGAAKKKYAIVFIVILFSLRLFIAYLFSYFGSQAAELFFFQKDIDAKLSVEVVNGKGEAEKQEPRLALLKDEIQVLKLKIEIAEQAELHEKMPPNQRKVGYVAACLKDKKYEVVVISALKDGCFYSRPFSGVRGVGGNVERLGSDIKALRTDLDGKEKDLVNLKNSLQSDVEGGLAVGGYGKRIDTLRNLEKTGVVDASLVRRLVLAMELMPTILKITSVLFLFYQSPLSRYMFTIEDEFCEHLRASGAAGVALEEPQEDKERLLEKGMKLLESHVPVLLFLVFPVVLYLGAPQDFKSRAIKLGALAFAFFFE